MRASRRRLLCARPISRLTVRGYMGSVAGCAVLMIAAPSRADDAPLASVAATPPNDVAAPTARPKVASSTPDAVAAADKKSPVPSPEAAPAESQAGWSRRAGLVLGSGYPNDAKYIDNESYRGATGALPGYGWNLFVLGAISREINVGFWGGTSAFENANWKSRASGGGLRVEAFPFGGLLGALRNTALYTNLGIGSTKSEVKLPGNYAALAGTQSFIAVGAFHELNLARRFTLAPDARYEAVVTRAGAHSAFIVGVRVAFHLTE
jgi:hypothetical protein